MNDTLAVKPIQPANLTGTDFGAALNFARADIQKSGHGRINTALGLASPTVLRVAHTPRPKGSGAVQRSVFEIAQTYARFDPTSGALVAAPVVQWSFSVTFPEGVTEAEVLAPFYQATGALLENTAVLIKEFVQGQH